MARRIWTISDTHFGHANALTFMRADGITPLRDFKDVEEMDECMVARWNEVVHPEDHVYHLGDVAIHKRGLEICKRLQGHKRLVAGNHDIYHTKDYVAVGFEKVMGVRVFPKTGIILSHIPLHPNCLKDRAWVNWHGHLHSNVMMRDGEPDPNYRCVSVEQIDYRPVLLPV